MKLSFVFIELCFTELVSMVTVQQPPIVPAIRGQDVVLPCFLRLYPEDQLTEPPVLYWKFNPQSQIRVWVPSETYQGRVSRLNGSSDSQDYSIRLRDVRWSDGGLYLCMLTVTTKTRDSFRRSGNRTALGVHDRLVLVRGGPGDSWLGCEVNVSRDADFTLSVLHRGALLQPVAGDRDAAGGAQPFVTLSQTVSLQGPGRYECRLLLQGQLVTASSFHVNRTAAACGGACVEVESDTEAVAGEPFKLGCISCKTRGEVKAEASVSWAFMAKGDTQFSELFFYETSPGLILDERFEDRLNWSGSKNTRDLQDGSIYILNVTFNDTGTYRCFFNRVLIHTNHKVSSNPNRTIVLTVVPRLTREMASILSEVMMYVSIVGLQLWLVVEMIYCYRKISAAGEEALRENASRRDSIWLL
ncbi:sodium channel, voltage-gated, type I, beta a isoform X2 [Salarias fasciatus]|uniref:Sodium channel regulatory subunit beta-3 n=1 Tax=Salarias fasciatus TaxID=181472 RepID=A0A672G1H8_SALFA|nr:uncharacterized protein LOC115397354 isoform X2 [Salarias fasciatus]